VRAVRWATIRVDNTSAAGLLVGDAVHIVGGTRSVADLLGDDGERMHTAADRAVSDPRAVVPLDGAALLAPIPHPPTVRDFYAFETHVATARRSRGLEMEPQWYQQPVFYFSNPYSVIGPGDAVSAPPGCRELDFELEVAAVVGRSGHDLDPADADAYIAGYCVMNDWSARDLQRAEMHVGLGPAKGKDFATSLGPCLVTPDELAPHRVGKAYDLTMTATVNGVEYSRANLSSIYWSFGEMLAHASRGTRVEPGDVIGSGTCGTGCLLELRLVHGGTDFPWLEPGDAVVLSVDELGSLANTVVGEHLRSAARPPSP